jgi:hypothetical protein
MKSQIFVVFFLCLAKIGHLAIVEVYKTSVLERWIDVQCFDGNFLGI